MWISEILQGYNLPCDLVNPLRLQDSTRGTYLGHMLARPASAEPNWETGGKDPRHADLEACQRGKRTVKARASTCGTQVLYTILDHPWEATFLAIESH